MYLDFEFEELDNSFELEFEQVTEISDGGYDRGYAEGYSKGDADGQAKGRADGETIGYENALAKRTDLVATENGEYTPSEDSTGFKSVSVSVKDTRLNQYINGTLTEVTAEDFNGISTLRDYTFYQHPTLKRVEFAENLWSAGNSTFRGCPKLEIVDFSKCTKVRYLGMYTFYGCTSIRELTIPSTVERIDQNTFENCTSLKSVTFGENAICNQFYAYSFSGCTSLVEITIPASVKNLGSFALKNCTSLKLVKLKPKTPPSVQLSTFQNVPTDCVYMVDYGCGEAYRNATNWSTLANQIVEGDV